MKLSIAGNLRTIQLIGIKAPRGNSCGKSQSKGALKNKLGREAKVKLKTDSKGGKNDR